MLFFIAFIESTLKGLSAAKFICIVTENVRISEVVSDEREITGSIASQVGKIRAVGIIGTVYYLFYHLSNEIIA